MASNDLKDKGLNESNLENAYKRDDIIKFKSKFDSFVNGENTQERYANLLAKLFETSVTSRIPQQSSNQKKWKWKIQF
ncbi:hypothetical protein NC651_012812 [Populus alba x Populus x berolinensis]|nr:hypothetical protein NC651_012812 [Populus alba x Populus x berolinensis]